MKFVVIGTGYNETNVSQNNGWKDKMRAKILPLVLTLCLRAMCFCVYVLDSDSFSQYQLNKTTTPLRKCYIYEYNDK